MTSDEPVIPIDPSHALKPIWDRVAKASVRALILDYDGTLSPFCNDRHRAFPYPGVRAILEALVEENNCRVVVVSGRPIEDLIPLLGLETLPEIWGAHGIERRKPDGHHEIRSFDDRAASGLNIAYAWAETHGQQDRCEQKPGCLAFHWRGLPRNQVELLRQKVSEAWDPIARASKLDLKPFDGGLELRVSGMHKGDAVKTILSEIGDEGIVAFLGDDITDEDAFMALKGVGFGVLVREQWRPTSADCWIKPPDQLLAFLQNWLHACRKGNA